MKSSKRFLNKKTGRWVMPQNTVIARILTGAEMK
jgi:hypothetical protein